MHAQACAGHDARGLCRRKHVSADPCGRPREVAFTPRAARECSRVPETPHVGLRPTLGRFARLAAVSLIHMFLHSMSTGYPEKLVEY